MKQPFDAAAAEYDQLFTHSVVGGMQRAITDDLTDAVIQKLQPGRFDFDVLEINCGTGEDACRIAARGLRVLATDASPGMIAVAADKVRAAGMNGQVQCRVVDFAGLSAIPETGFPVILSNFGGLNCIPPTQMADLCRALEQKSAPGGYLIVVVMSQFCLWETVYFLLKGKPGKAFRRSRRSGARADVGNQSSMTTWYYSTKDMRQHFKTWRLLESRPVGFWVPPSYLNPFFEKRPRLLRRLFLLEKKCRQSFWTFGADHIALVFQKNQ